MKRIRILGRKKPTQLAAPIVEQNVEKAVDEIKAVPKADDIVATIQPSTRSPLMDELEARLMEKSKAAADIPPPLAEVDALDLKVKKNIVGVPKTPMPSPSSAASPAPYTSTCSKESLESVDISELLEIKTDDDQVGIECKQLMNNTLTAKETARFLLTLESPQDVSGFVYSIQTAKNFIHTSQIESIEGNKISIVINNLSNKGATFNISYVAIF